MIFRLAIKDEDITGLCQLEQQSQSHPWNQQQISDCFGDFYEFWVDPKLNCYGVIRVVAEQAELINICVNPSSRRRGFAQQLLCHLHDRSTVLQAETILLEVRAGNKAALALYYNNGYDQISLRKAYYPSASGREDALVLQKKLIS